MEAKFKLGDVLKDLVTGYEGACLGITFYFTDCTHYGLISRSLDEKGKVRDWLWFDETRLTATGERVELAPREKPVSGIFPDPPEA